MGTLVAAIALLAALSYAAGGAGTSVAAGEARGVLAPRSPDSAARLGLAAPDQGQETPTDEPPPETEEPTPEEPTEFPTEFPTDPYPAPATGTMEPTATVEGPTPIATLPAPQGGDDDEKDRIGYIKGVACIDLDQDGKLDPDDPGLNDVAVHLRGGGLDLVIVTGATGQFSFDGLGKGRYDVFVAPGPEWRVTTKSRYDGVRVRGDVVQNIDFCMARVSNAPDAKDKHKDGAPRLPKTGIADLPAPGLLALATLILGLIAATGFVYERRR